jgi:hypothetical protein
MREPPLGHHRARPEIYTLLPPGVYCFQSFFITLSLSAVRWLCKLFVKALVAALACGALAMCLQIELVAF